MGAKKKVVILGAGYAGMEAAKILAKRFKKNDDVEITLIDQNPFHTLMTELHEIAGHRTEKESVMVDIRRIFKASKVNFVRDTIDDLDHKEKVLKSKNNSYPYDYLILGLGSEPAFFGVEGVEENSLTIWSLKDALKIRRHINDMFLQARDTKDPELRKKLLTFVIAGAGFTGVEVVGELMDWKKILCREYEIDEDEVTIYNIEAMPYILPILRESLREKAMRFMKRRKVKVMVNSPIVKVTEDTVFIKDGTQIKANTIIWTCGVQANPFCVREGLPQCKGNRISVDDYLEVEGMKDVYAVGDNAYYEVNGKPMPQIVETALQSGECAAKNIAADILGNDRQRFNLKTHGFMVSIGSHYCVAELAGIPLTSFLAMAMKHLVNLHYLWGLGGVRLIWNYLRHEFFYMRDNRSFVGGHLSSRVQTVWLVPLRLYVGVMWLIEGINKVKDGWLNPNNIKIIPQAVSGASQTAAQTATDTVSSASQVAGNAAQAAGNAAAAVPTPIFEHPPAFYQWFTNVFVKPNAFLFQATVVCLEIAIGLALIVGLLTFLASIGSIFLCGNFILSAMAGYDVLWYVFASIALMGGAGKAFGMDAYVIPYIKRVWLKFRLAHRTQWYFD